MAQMLVKRLFWTGYLAYQLRGQVKYAYRPLAALRRDQDRRVRRTVAYAYRRVPYYRETMDRLGLAPSDIRTADDLAKLPLLEREQFQRDPQLFSSTARFLGGTLALRTSGSANLPCTTQHDARGVFRAVARDERMRAIIASLVGKRLGYRAASIFDTHSATKGVRDFVRAHTWLPRGVPVQGLSLGAHEPVERLVERLNEFRPDAISSYGSTFESLFTYLHATGRPFHRPKVVLYGADALADGVRRLISDEFGIHVLSGYAANETATIAFECEQHTGMHLNLDLNAVRIVDAEGRTLPPGQHGEVVASNLVNRASVLLNYRLGDLAALLPEPCPCGRSLPLLSFPQGRTADVFELPSGRLVQPGAVRKAFETESDVWQFQVVQEAPARIHASLVVAPACERGPLQERIAAKLAAAFRGEPAIAMSFVDAIERSAGGKRLALVPLPRRHKQRPDPSEGDAAPPSRDPVG